METADWKFETSEHGGDQPDNMPQAITATDPAGRWAVYVPLTRCGKIVIPCPYSAGINLPQANDDTDIRRSIRSWRDQVRSR